MKEKRTSKTNEIGNISDLISKPAPASTAERLAALETRLARLEGLLADTMYQLDLHIAGHAAPKSNPKPKPKPKSNANGQPKAESPPKAKRKKTPPSKIISALLEKAPQSRAEIQAASTLDEEGIKKCLVWMSGQGQVEKDATDKDDAGNSRWRLKG